MSDLAALGFSADTSGLKQIQADGEAAASTLIKVADGTDKVNASADTLGKSAKGVAEDVKKITEATAEHGKSADAAAKATKGAAEGTTAHGDAAKKAAESVNASAAANESLAKSLGAIAQMQADGQRAATAWHGALDTTAAKNAANAQAAITHANAVDTQTKSIKALTAATVEHARQAALPSPGPAPVTAPAAAPVTITQTAGGGHWTHTPAQVAVRAYGLGAGNPIKDAFYGGRIGAREAMGTAPQGSVDEYWQAVRDRQEQLRMLRERDNGHGGSEHGPLYEAERAAQRKGGVIGQAIHGIRDGISEGSGIGRIVEGGVAGAAGFLAAGAVEKGVEAVHELYEEIKKAGEEADAMGRKWEGFGKGEEVIGRIRDAAMQTGASFKNMSDEMAMLEEQFTRFQSNTSQNLVLDKSLRMAVTNSGGSEANASAFVKQTAPLFDKLRVTSADITNMNSAAPGSADEIAKQLGIGGGENGLKQAAANGQVTGEAFGQAWVKAYGDELSKSKALGTTLEQSENKANASADKLNEGIARVLNLRSLLTGAQGLASDANLWLADHLPGAGAAKEREEQEEREKKKAVPKPNVNTKLAEENANNDTNYSRYATTSTQREDAQKDLASIDTQIAHLLAAGDALDSVSRKSLANLQQWRKEAVRMAKGPVTAFQQLTKETQAFAGALEMGGGGAADMWKQAASLAEQQRRMVGAASKDAKDFLLILQQQRRLEGEKEIQDNSARATQQGVLAHNIAAGGTHGDDLRIQADAEAATWRFQKFGETIKDNDEIVTKYADGLYKLKLALRDVSDASEAKSMKRDAEATSASNDVLAAGGTREAAARAARDVKDRYFEQDRNTRAVAATKDATYTVKGDGSDPVAATPQPRATAPAPAPSTSRRDTWMKAIGGAEPSATTGLTPEQEATWRRMIQMESSGRPGIVGPATKWGNALGMTQLLPSTARGVARDIGIPYRADLMTSKTAEGAAYQERLGRSYFKQGLDRYHGDPAMASMFYHGGPDQKQWGPITRDYAARATGKGSVGVPANDDAGSVDQVITLKGSPGRAAGPSAENKDAIAARRAQEDAADNSPLSAALGQLKRENNDAPSAIAAISTGSVRAVKDDELDRKISDIRDAYSSPGQEKNRDELIQQTKIAAEMERQRTAATEIGKLRSDQQSLESEYSLLKYSGDELKVQTELLREKNKLIAQGVDLNGADGKRIMAETESNARKNVKNDKAANIIKGAKDDWSDAAKGMGSSIESALNTAFTKGSGAGKAMLEGLGDTAMKLLDKIFEAAVVNPLVNAISNVGGSAISKALSGLMGGGPAANVGGDFSGISGASASSLTSSVSAMPSFSSASANGNVFGEHGLVPFALGGTTYKTPTRLAMANGGTALVGEAGGDGEAVMPLKRGADGRLGVASSGGGSSGPTNVTIHDQRGSSNAEPIKVQERQTSDGKRHLEIMVRDTVKAQTRGGAFDSDNEAQYGIKRTVARR
jgi:tape measure domain-containing protein